MNEELASEVYEMNIFDIIGPVMVGPSSSHTAGAVRIGKIARAILGEEPKNAIVRLHGSFARTYFGHGTDKAIIGGILGFNPDDYRIKYSLDMAMQAGIKYRFEKVNLKDAHPNSSQIVLTGLSGKCIQMTGASVGGGNVIVKEINGMRVEFNGDYPTLIVIHKDIPGMVADVTGILANSKLNIARMNLFRSQRGGKAVMIIEVDQTPQQMLKQAIESIPEVTDVTFIEARA